MYVCPLPGNKQCEGYQWKDEINSTPETHIKQDADVDGTNDREATPTVGSSTMTPPDHPSVLSRQQEIMFAGVNRLNLPFNNFKNFGRTVALKTSTSTTTSVLSLDAITGDRLKVTQMR